MVKQHPDEGALMRYVDAEMGADEYRMVEQHVAHCAACRDTLQRLVSASLQAGNALEKLSPGPLERPDKRRALTALTESVTTGEQTMLEKIKNNRRTQRILIGAAAFVIVVGLFALPPVRALASDFLGLFRVQTFAFVGVDTDRLIAIFEALGEQDNLFMGEEIILEEPGEPVPVASVEDAAAQVGFTPRLPEDYGLPTEVYVTGSTHVQYILDVETLRAVMSILEIDPAALPENIDGQVFEFTIEDGILMFFDDNNDRNEHDFSILQIPSPSASYPEDTDITALGEVLLRVFGMSEREAARLAQQIDWTSTVVLPVPIEIATVREARIHGQTGLLLETLEGSSSALVWEEDGIVTLITAETSYVNLIAVGRALK
nr:zf-HC2 domain-containing protein [Anaerolineae bacterium]